MDALSDGALMSNDDIFPYIRGSSNKLWCLRRQGTKRRQLIIFMIFCSSHVFTITNTFVPERQPLLPYHQEKAKNKRGGQVWKGVHWKRSRFKMEGANRRMETMLGGYYNSHPKDLPEIHTLKYLQEISGVFGGKITGRIFLSNRRPFRKAPVGTSLFDTPGLFSSFYFPLEMFLKLSQVFMQGNTRGAGCCYPYHIQPHRPPRPRPHTHTHTD